MERNSTYIKYLLEQWSEEALPSGEIHLWPAIQSSLNANARQSKKGISSINATVRKPSPRLQAILIVAVLMILLVMFATPQGRALAQEILHFFTRAPSDTLPLQSFQLTHLPTLDLSTPTPDRRPTPAGAKGTVLPTLDSIMPTPDPASIIDANQTVQEVEKRAGFEVLEPAYLPNIISFTGASFDPEHHIARIFYRYWDTNGLVLREEPYQTNDNCELCGVVGASAAVETVQIGNVTGEYAEGVWSLTENGPVWDPNPYLKTLRWQANGMAFELLYMGPPSSVTKEEMIAIAKSLK